MSTRPPLRPFTYEAAVRKVRLADDGWNSRDPEKVALAYTPNCQWRNCSEFDDDGLMRLRLANINDLPIKESERKYRWPLGRRPDDHPGLSDHGF